MITTTTKAQTTLVITGDLTEFAKDVNKRIDAIADAEQSVHRATLPDRLAVGLLCAKAHSIFAMSAQNRATKAGKSRTNSRRELVRVSETKSNIPESFSAWLAIEIPRLREAVAYKYMKAVAGLGLEPDADPITLRLALATWEEQSGVPASLASLVASATIDYSSQPPQLQNQTPAPQLESGTPQDEFDFIRACSSDVRTSVETACSIKDRLPTEFRRALSAQFYAGLYELTGTHWAPSNEAPDLANVDPSSIQI